MFSHARRLRRVAGPWLKGRDMWTHGRKSGWLAALTIAVALCAPAVASAQDEGPTAEVCSSGVRTLSNPGDRVYPDQGNGGYTSLHTDVHTVYDTAANQFLPGNHVELTVVSTQCLTDFSFDFERTALSGAATGPNMTVTGVSIDGSPATFDFRRPTYPGNPNGPDDPDPAAHAISNVNPVSATNPNPPACSPQTSGNAQNGMQCPANKLVITPATPIPTGTTMTVRIDYTGRPGLHFDGDGSTEGWFRVNTAAAPNDGSFVTTEPVGSMAWMPLNNHPSAKPTYDVYDTVPAGKTAIAPGTLVGSSIGSAFTTPAPTAINPPDANFPGGSWMWHWHSPEPIANYLVTNTIGSYDLVARTSTLTGVEYYQAMASGLTPARKATIQNVLNTQEDITTFQQQFAGPYPFTTAGVIVALPNAGFEEEMQTKITFGNGANTTPSASVFHHEQMHQWFGDNVSEAGFRLTFWKEGWAQAAQYLLNARNASNAAPGGAGSAAGKAAFDNTLITQFNSNYNTGSSTFWTSAPSNPTVGNLFTSNFTYVRPATAYLALRQILDASASRPASDRWIGAMKQIQSQYGGATITEAQLENVFHQWLPNQSPGCHTRLDTFFTQWFDTSYPSGGGANRPQITGPGLAGPGFYNDAGACTRADQTIDFAALADKRPSDPDFAVSATASSGLPVSFAATGQCTVSGATVHLTGVGTCTITASQAGDNVYKAAPDVARTFNVHGPIVTNDAPAAGATVQYSDSLSPAVTISASDTGSEGSTMTASASGLPAGLSLAVDSTSGAGVLPGTRSWHVDGTVTAAPASYPVTVTVTDDAGTTGSTSFTIVVAREDAEATYTGDELAFTPANGSSAAVVLRATVRDSSEVAGSGDAEPGDIANATVSLSEGATTLCGPTAPASLNGSTTVGTVACTATLGLGAHTIDVSVDGRYVGSTQTVIEVAQPNGSFVTGGGHTDVSASAGTYAASAGSRMNFAFNVKYARNMTNLQGHASVIFRVGPRTYQAKSTATDSLGIVLKTPGGAACSGPPSPTCIAQAQFRSKANLADITNPAKPISVAGNLALQAGFTDKGSEDAIGVTLWNGSSLVFSSHWTGSKTVEDLLTGGSIVVH
jgi:putative Ig domain-containing protein